MSYSQNSRRARVTVPRAFIVSSFAFVLLAASSLTWKPMSSSAAASKPEPKNFRVSVGGQKARASSGERLMTIPVLPLVSITVDRTDDIFSASACTAALNDCSLRGAVAFANLNPGTTINVPAGTYDLAISGAGEGFNGDDSVGDLDITADNTTIIGAGAASTIVHQTQSGDRVIEVNPFLDANFNTSISNVTISGGTETTAIGGGGIISGAVGNTLTLTNCVISGNSATGAGTAGGGGVSHAGGNLNITGCTFSNNSTSASGGGLGYSAGDPFGRTPSPGTLAISGSTFTSNTANSSAAGGGAADLFDFNGGVSSYNVNSSTFSGNVATNASGGAIIVESGGPLTITTSSFSGNHAGNFGGAISLAGTSASVAFSRLVGNTVAVPTQGLTVFRSSGAFSADDNWWGVNSGPSVNDVRDSSGTVTVAVWLQLEHTASPDTVCTEGISSLTADIKKRNTGLTLTTELNGLPAFPVPSAPIFTNAVLGTLSGASTEFVNGTATATFTAGSTAGTGGADASADNQTVTASIIVQEVTSATTPSDQTVCQGATANFSTTASGAGPFHYTWTLDGSPFDGDNSSISVPTSSLSVGSHAVSVTVTGSCGPGVTRSATLTVQASTSTTKPNDQTVCAGSTASFSTTASGTGPFSFVWKKGAVVLHTGDLGGRVTITSGSDTSTLTISNVQSTDAGTYTVETTGACGLATQNATLTLDSTPPTITCPANITVEPTCPSGAVVTYTAPVGTDNCPGATTALTAGLASGSVFPIGTTTVTYTVTDTSGNSASCSFTVTVKTVFQTIEDLKTSINSSSLSGPQKQGLIAKLNAAEDALAQGHTSTACQKLADFINSVQNYIDHGDISAAVGQAWISTAAHVRNTLGCTNLGCT